MSSDTEKLKAAFENQYSRDDLDVNEAKDISCVATTC